MKLLVWLMVLHFIADFILQSREMGQKKSSEIEWLLRHLAIQYAVVYFGLLFVVGSHNTTVFTVINTLVHGVIDWNIWKAYKWSAYYRIKNGKDKHLFLKADGVVVLEDKWYYWEDHLFYTCIGFDQMLHISTLIILAYCLGLV